MQSKIAYTDFLESKKNAGLFRQLAGVDRSTAREITVAGKCYLNFSSNNYLALARHPCLTEQASHYVEKYGTGCGASRLVTGNLDLFEKIEERLAALKSKPAALLFASGFQANVSILQALFDKRVLKAEPLVFADRLNHASMHWGCKCAGVRQIRYRHLDLDHLRELLEKHADDQRPKFILSESVFSMDGDVADFAQLSVLAKRHEALLICDDAHATGILGEGGVGLSEGAELVIGTFSKALGGFGAYIACSHDIRDYLINHCAGFIYSTAPPPAMLGAMDAALSLLPQLERERAHVAGLAEQFRDELRARDLDFGGSKTQIVPVILGAQELVVKVSQKLRQRGIWATAIRPPTVPSGKARLRITFTAAHHKEDVEFLLESLDKALELV